MTYQYLGYNQRLEVHRIERDFGSFEISREILEHKDSRSKFIEIPSIQSDYKYALKVNATSQMPQPCN